MRSKDTGVGGCQLCDAIDSDNRKFNVEGEKKIHKYIKVSTNLTDN